jgi:hypothetical protein
MLHPGELCVRMGPLVVTMQPIQGAAPAAQHSTLDGLAAILSSASRSMATACGARCPCTNELPLARRHACPSFLPLRRTTSTSTTSIPFFLFPSTSLITYRTR